MFEWEKKNLKIWILAIVATAALMIVILLFGQNSLNFTLVIFMMAVKFLSGFGICLGITSAVIWVLTNKQDKFRGEENRKNLQNFYIAILILMIFLIIYQGPWKIIESIVKQGSADSIVDKILFVYGIYSLMYSLYFKPLKNGTFIRVTTETAPDMVKKSVQETIRNIKTKYLTWRKDYGKAQLEEQISFKEHMEVVRERLAITIMIVLGVGNIIFTPICFIFIYLWWRIFFDFKNPMQRYERIALQIASIALVVIAIITSFVIEFTTFYTIIKTGYFFLYIAQFIGVLTGGGIYVARLLKPIREEATRKKIINLKEQQEQLEQERKELLKEKKGMQKELKKLHSEQQTSAQPEQKGLMKPFSKNAPAAAPVEDKSAKKGKKPEPLVQPPPVEVKGSKKVNKGESVPQPQPKSQPALVEDKSAKKSKKGEPVPQPQPQPQPAPVEDKKGKKQKKGEQTAQQIQPQPPAEPAKKTKK